MQVEPSQGTHFFQNMTSLGCIYLTVNPTFNEGSLDFSLLDTLERIEETPHFIHYHSMNDLVIKANGLEKKAVIRPYKEIVSWD